MAENENTSVSEDIRRIDSKNPIKLKSLKEMATDNPTKRALGAVFRFLTPRMVGQPKISPDFIATIVNNSEIEIPRIGQRSRELVQSFLQEKFTVS